MSSFLSRKAGQAMVEERLGYAAAPGLWRELGGGSYTAQRSDLRPGYRREQQPPWKGTTLPEWHKFMDAARHRAFTFLVLVLFLYLQLTPHFRRATLNLHQAEMLRVKWDCLEH
ncbi:hypothetical protein AAFF_G00057730 [Aldrovandia affinis]|uniref:Uncharacterized protein n=1 Tax=Aldrovandia affinis TaxID=143900 RepID=A0AAD7WEJ2_9TELE|nr:hypothetical protein AAFF_G00057730 [Aldrovandia affinis]